MRIHDPTRREVRFIELTTERTQIEQAIDKVRRLEDRRWLIDRNYQQDIADETCSRAFFKKKPPTSSSSSSTLSSQALLAAIAAVADRISPWALVHVAPV